MLKQVTLTPTQPQARQDALLPALRSRLKKILNVPPRVRFRFFCPAASLADPFEHPLEA
jgi:hypothetical protein